MANRADVQKTAALKVPILPHTSPEAPQPAGLKTPLYPHQLRALHRCLLIENDGSLAKDFGAFHDYKSRGGCLADAVGMGKTATSIGLILSSPPARNEGDTLVVAPSHLIRQWKFEIEKFTDAIEVLVGKREYERRSTLPLPNGKSHRVVLIDVETVIEEKKLWYDFRRVFSHKPPHGCRKHVSLAKMEIYKKAALFCVKSPRGPCSYEGYVYTGPLHHPYRPWRRVIFDEIQDLVSEGTESQKNLLQLSRTAKNVWLLSATPFPHGNDSVYANHELLGFCRLRMDVEVDYALSHNHPFEVIKRKLYIRSPKHVADDAVAASRKVTKETIIVEATALERKFFELEKNEIASRDTFSGQYDSLRQMMVHPEACKKLREQINGRDEDQRGGKNGRKVKQNNQRVGRFATVNSFAMRSLTTARERCKELRMVTIPGVEKEINDLRSSWYLALKIRQVRESPVQANPFAANASAAPAMCLEAEEADAIHKYYCSCSHYGSSSCEADSKVHFQTIRIGNTDPIWIRGHNSTQRVIDYFHNEVKIHRKIPVQANSQELREYLEVYIQRMEGAHKGKQTRKKAFEAERADVERRIVALEETVKVGNMNTAKMSEDEALKARNGSKCAELIKYLWEVDERGEQTIVFSYWHDVLTKVQSSLNSNDLSSVFCNGRTGNAMSNAIEKFTSGEVRILLLSAQVKASGANLQCATNVVLLDPAGSSAEHGATLEQQAIGRAVRMGQENSVKVVRFCVANTIEEELFEEIDLAAAKLVTRNNDNTYMCENAHKSLDKKVLAPKKKEVDDEVLVGESVSAKEQLNRRMAEARAKNEIIVLDDSDDDEEMESGDSKLKSLPKDMRMGVESAFTSQLKVKAEPSAKCVASVKRGNEEVNKTETEAEASPEKRAKVSPMWRCDVGCGSTFDTFALAAAHELVCKKASVKDKTNNAVMEDVAPSALDEDETNPINSSGVDLARPKGKLPALEDQIQQRAKIRKDYAELNNLETLNGHHLNWLNRFFELKLVKEASGMAWIRGQKSALGKFCAYQRREFRKHLKAERTTLCKERIRLLNGIGFPWSRDMCKPELGVTVSSGAVAETRVPPPPSSSQNKSDAVKQTEYSHGAQAATLKLQPQPDHGDARSDVVMTPSEQEMEMPIGNDTEDVLKSGSSVDLQTSVTLEGNLPTSPPIVPSGIVSPLTKERSCLEATHTQGIMQEEDQATPNKVQTKTVIGEEGRVVSPSVDQFKDVAKNETTADEGESKSGSDDDTVALDEMKANPLQIQPETVAPLAERANTENADAEKGCQVTSPSINDMEVSTAETVDGEDGLNNLLVRCELEKYLPKFQDAGISSACRLRSKLQDLSSMQEFVNNVGLTASEAIGLVFVASQQ